MAIEAASLRPLAFAEDCEEQPGRGIVILLYTAAAWEGEARALEEGSAVGWFTPDEIAALDRPPLDIALCEQIFGARR